MRDSRIGARQRVGAYPQSQTRRSSGQTVTTADGPTTRRVALLATCTTSSMGAATGCFGVATSMSPFPLAPRAALGRLEGRAAATRSRARASSLSPGPPGCIRRRPGGRSDRGGWRLCRSRRRRSCLVPTSSKTIACRSRRLSLGLGPMRAWHARRRLPAIRIKCSANSRVQAERGMSGCAFRLLEAGLAATDRHPICTGLGLGGDDHQRYRRSADSGNR